MTREPQITIRTGQEYVYTSAYPPGRAGHHYRVEGLVLAVPSYQEQVLVVALTGPDAGLLFVCSPANFACRYALASEPRKEEKTEKTAGYMAEKWRSGV